MTAVQKDATLLRDLGAITAGDATYDGYGSWPLTVERSKIDLAAVGYDGKLVPNCPAWLLSQRMLPPIDWMAMLKGRAWMAKPEIPA